MSISPIIDTASRRSFLRTTAVLCATGFANSVDAVELPNAVALPSDPLIVEPEVEPEIKAAVETERSLRLINENTRERLHVVYWKDGHYIDDHVGQLNYFMRDHHVNKSALMDKRLYDLLYRLYGVLDTDEQIHILSGYRTAATNASLRKRWPDVAQRSYHIRGRAADIYIPGISNHTIQREARNLKLGGVGYYKKAGFIHLDTGFARHWVKA